MPLNTRSLTQALFSISTIFTLFACGGGGSVSRDDSTDSGSSDGSSATIVVTLSLENDAGVSDKSLTINNPLTLVAEVKDTNGNPQSDRLLTFAISEPTLANFSNDIATARTNEDGIASIGLTVGTASGDGEITASLSSGESGTTTFSSEGSGGANIQPASLLLYASAVQLASSGNDEIELIALVKNEQSVLVEGVEVSFSAPSDAGVELQLTQSVTAADGTARAIITSQNDASNRDVRITAQTGTLVEYVDIEVSGTEVTINGATSVILNDTVEYTLRVQDSDGEALPNQTITLTPGTGTLSTTSVVSGADGQASVFYTATTSGEDSFSAAALSALFVQKIQVQQDEFEFVQAPTEEVALSTSATIVGRWQRDNSALEGREVRITASRGTVTTEQPLVTDNNGEFSFDIASDNAGFSTITASGLGTDGSEEVVATLEVECIATTPYYIQVDASTEILGPDGQTSSITAIIRDENDNLVKGALVSFNVDDPSTGTISPSQATTDSNGIATTVYTSGAVSSHESVVITAQAVEAPEVQDEVLLTVGNRAFDISIGTGNTILVSDDTSYTKEFAVFVSDSAGQPVSDVELTASISPVKWVDGGGYYKGSWYWTGTVWAIDTPVYFCENEDQNDNGILDIAPEPSTYDEDTNDDGMLTPGIIGTVNFASDAITDENGQATLAYRYPQNYGGWVEMVVTVYGKSSGSEAIASMRFGLEAAADDLSSEESMPPPNPFGSDACPIAN